MAFKLDHRLEADSIEVAQWPLSGVRLMNDARYPWLILVPRRSGATEFIDLSPDDRSALGGEIARASKALKSLYNPDKMNIGMLGNIVSQLHVHVVARHAGDPGWPGPVWGVGAAVAYEDSAIAAVRQRLKLYFDENP